MTRQGRYPPELRERAVRMVFEQQDEHASQWAAICSIAAKFGISHDRATQVALQVGGARRHPSPLHRDRPGEGVRRRRAGEPDTDPDQRVAQAYLPVGAVLLP
jgi:transposase-like protein